MGEGRVVDDLDPGRSASTTNRVGRRSAPSTTFAITTKTEATSPEVTNHFSPLSRKPRVGALGGRGDRRRVGAGVALGHRVGVVELAAQGGAEVAVDVLVGGVGPDVVGVRDVPVDRVGGAAELLLDQRPLDRRPALAAVLGRVQPAVEPGRERLRLTSATSRRAACRRAHSASSSSGISTSSMKRRARLWRSRAAVSRPGRRTRALTSIAARRNMRLTTRSMTQGLARNRAKSTAAPPRPARRRAAPCSRVERATMLPPAAFADPGVLDWELDNIFRGWIVRRPRLRRRRARQVLHARARHRQRRRRSAARTGRPRAFLNVCRHRGARIVEETEGQVRKRLRCPYHAWSYDLDGKLRAAPHMDGVEDFDSSCYGLLAVRLAVVGGLVLIDLSGEAPEPDEHVGELLDHLDRYRLAELRRAGETDLRGRRQLEGHRRELQRVPALPRRPPGAERAQRLHERRGGRRRRRLVRRLDDPARGRRDDGARTAGHTTDRPPIEGLTEERGATRPLLRALPQRAGLAASRLRDAAHPVAARRRAAPTSSASGSSSRRRWRATTSTPPTRSASGTRSTGRTGTSASSPQKGVGSRGYIAGRYSAEEVDVHAFDPMVADRYMEALRRARTAEDRRR